MARDLVLLLLADMLDADDAEAQAALAVLRDRLTARESVAIDDYGNIVIGLRPIHSSLTIQR